MKLISAIKLFFSRLNEIDKNAKKFSENRNSTNPFDFKFARTYAWIEKRKNKEQ